MNPLIHIKFRIPFDQIQASDVVPAVDELLFESQKRLEETIRSDRPLEALDVMTERLDYCMSVVRHLEAVATTPELRDAHNAVQPKVSAFYSSLPLNEDLWKAIQRYGASDEVPSRRQRITEGTIQSTPPVRSLRRSLARVKGSRSRHAPAHPCIRCNL